MDSLEKLASKVESFWANNSDTNSSVQGGMTKGKAWVFSGIWLIALLVETFVLPFF